MESRNLSRASIIRLVAVVICIAAVIFFGVRFIRNRQATRSAAQVTQTTQEDKSSSETQTNSGPQAAQSQDQPAGSNNASNTQNGSSQTGVPSGIDDLATTPNTGATALPETGISKNVVISTVLLSVVVLLVLQLKQTTQELRK